MLNTMLSFFEGKNHINSFTSGKDCLDFLSNYKSPLLKYNFLKTNVQDENYGLTQHLPMNFDLTELSSLSADKTRHNEITVMVIDYCMPTMDGFELANHLKESPIKKMMLTGNRNDSKAIEGFNSNLIQRFVQKGTENLVEKISHYLKELSLQYFQNISLPLLSYLETEEKLPLSDPTFFGKK
ncbi:MAG: response regulator [Gammaproteobacteria bacterium]|nr:response regulator [Gammaproteobacteria bacterium]